MQVVAPLALHLLAFRRFRGEAEDATGGRLPVHDQRRQPGGRVGVEWQEGGQRECGHVELTKRGHGALSQHKLRSLIL